MKRSLALALAAVLGLGLLSTSFAGFAQHAYGGVTSWRGTYGTTGGYQAYYPLKAWLGNRASARRPQ
jgi:hypothetical protein